MAFLFTNTDILDTLRGDAAHPIYNFVEIHVTGLGNWSNGIFLTDFVCNVEPGDGYQVADKDGVYRTWYSDLLKGVSTPARTGNVTQEIQRLQIAQGLSYQFADASEDILTALGAEYHNAPIRVSAYMQDPNNQDFITSEPILRSNGIIKALSRNVKENTIDIEFSNSFGKLDGLKELRTTPGSLYRRTPVGADNDTSFDKANIDIDGNILKWGVS
jgi:hypothetical protein